MKKILKFLLLTIAISILLFPRWLAHHFGDQVTFEQFLFHIFSGTRGLTKGMIGAEREFIYSFMINFYCNRFHFQTRKWTQISLWIPFVTT